ncbi:type VII secretion-associated protein [Gordonia phthalatica]|uniref:Type VII secretion-associated protein n=1 Tax=Gordonia phthalatica TaxID=1136941 RepID=A0A0N9N7W9_9ACTN|nr:type VII secretion-associated protein [Gordonia phthalatica]ALG84155.1 hypothetical protein ACH46_06090 [Gordonia phthalatica]
MTAPLLDLGYGRVDCGDQVLDVTPMLEEIDSASRRGVARRTFGALVRRCAGAGTVTVPTVWGPVRTGSMMAELHGAGFVGAPVPRAVAIAASHADAAAARVVVVETGLLPATGGHWSAHLVERRGDRWDLGRGEVTLPTEIPTDPGWARLLEYAAAVFVDGPDRESVGRAVDVLSASFGVRGVVVDRTVLVAFGGRTRAATGADLLAGLAAPPAAKPRRSTRVPAAVAGALLLATSGAAAWTHWPRETSPAQQTAQVGQAELTVPGAWLRTDQGSEVRGGDRAVFAAPDDGRRLIVVVSALRSGSTPTSVAESLRNRIAQRGDDVVAEFSENLDYAGRRVIGYRENPASGAPVAWYVTVDGGTQVSIGCQEGTGEESVEAACRGAVGSVRVTVL